MRSFQAMETAMNNEGQTRVTSGVPGDAQAAALRDDSDYAEEDCGCRPYRRGHSFEFLEILGVLAER